ncbi:hypothetical protein PV367_12315 [Streptomyces europaeiscabiei]|uniref:Transglycosylase SLT domain-containing protein n=1 Tax=Streptomyces europaeiscabiei TaxID=146819 RepID=A0AAJ2ULC5_9ACTN|nr:hypothetical protein [Streptomyces europaeiscabiei]MDX3130561.1 hypothetical protein [Streptomyces europaeiscabiei]
MVLAEGPPAHVPAHGAGHRTRPADLDVRSRPRQYSVTRVPAKAFAIGAAFAIASATTAAAYQPSPLKHPGQFSPPDTLRVAAKLKDPLYNAKTAKAIKHAHNWNQWSTFTNGAYKQYMDGGPASPTNCEPFPGASFFHTGKKSPVIAAMHHRLVVEGCNRYQSSANADVWVRAM